MASILIQQKVKDFSTWKDIYESRSGFRASSGALSSQVYREVDDPNQVTLIFKWDSLANAQKFASSPQLKASMEEAGVLGAPSVSFLNEA
jgi:quinol monooxygenase YgiN